MDYDTPSSTNDRAIYNSNKRRGSPSSTSLHINKSKSLSYPKSPRLGGGYSSNGSAGAHVHNAQPDTPRHVSASSSYNTHQASHPSSYVTAPHPTRSPSSSSSTYNSTTTSSSTRKSPVEVRHGKRPGQIWLPEGVVDMTSFGPILDMDETDATREFSKALVWAWCDQAEMALEEMEMHLAAGNIVPLADKAHYLKGSSASLGLVKVSSTCQSIYHTHFPPSLAHLRAFSYTGKGNSELSSKVHSSGSGSSGTSSSSSSNSNSSSSLASPTTPYSSDTSMEDSPFASFGAASDKMQYSLSHSPQASPSEHQHQAFPFEMTAAMTAPNGEGAATILSPSPGIYASHGYMPSYTAPILSSPTAIQGQAGANSKGTRDDNKQMDSAAEVAAHFERMKLQRAGALLAKLRLDVKQGSEWLYTYYRESDKFAGVPCYGI